MRRARLSLSVQYAADAEGEPPPRARVRALTMSALPGGGEVTVRFVGRREMTTLNRRHRGKNRATNVLSFRYDGEKIIGDIVICCPEAAREAGDFGRAAADHYAHLIVHGCLHLAGFGHDTAVLARRMEDSERRILRRFGVADPY